MRRWKLGSAPYDFRDDMTGLEWQGGGVVAAGNRMQCSFPTGPIGS
eukprot:CAMPEP_0183765060 /NCGR_PEP_ID=MMETSP0739-20130205/10703_1 /TAXON_ID=385413 /ORGANISM="Thalassiosira miniscula, Strain CCMP1093" /LENGTH=45 /DNA_ID= /DNA_START= /DNA_END= /DNA_ORIENTATION=